MRPFSFFVVSHTEWRSFLSVFRLTYFPAAIILFGNCLGPSLHEESFHLGEVGNESFQLRPASMVYLDVLEKTKRRFVHGSQGRDFSTGAGRSSPSLRQPCLSFVVDASALLTYLSSQ